MQPEPHPLPLSMRSTLSLIAAALLCTAWPAWAADPNPSRIAEVKLYPGSATVQRVARASAGSRTLGFHCLPAGLDVQSLQVAADAAVRVGETSVRTEDRSLSAACADSPLDGRIRSLEDQKAALQAESDALGFVTGYLKGFGGTDDATRAPADARSLAATADALRRTGQDALQRRYQIARSQADIDKQLGPLLAERERAQGRGDKVVSVTVTLATARDADVTLSYQIRGPGWTPAYRALLDTTTRRLRLERQALVAQNTGEDWRGVRMLLSTGQPQRNTSGRTPTPWRVGIAPPPPPQAEMARAAPAMAMAAPAPMAERSAQEEPLFDVAVFQNSFATEFSVPQAIDLPSGGQRVAVALGQHEDQVDLAVRTSPKLEAAAYLVAEFAQPPGVWPAGALQLYRDGAFVGSTRWTPPQEARASLSFGIDELVRVTVEPERDNQGSGGFIGTRAERSVQRAYAVENRHSTPIALQVLEAAPVAVDEQVRVTTQFTPQPAELAWMRQPGLAMWRQALPAGQSARFTADYTIGYPKDARLQMR